MSDESFIAKLIDVLGEWHDEEACDGPDDVLAEVRVAIAHGTVSERQRYIQPAAALGAEVERLRAFSTDEASHLRDLFHANERLRDEAAGWHKAYEELKSDADAVVGRLREKYEHPSGGVDL